MGKGIWYVVYITSKRKVSATIMLSHTKEQAEKTGIDYCNKYNHEYRGTFNSSELAKVKEDLEKEIKESQR